MGISTRRLAVVIVVVAAAMATGTAPAPAGPAPARHAGVPAAPATLGPPHVLAVTSSGANAAGRITAPGLACPDGPGSYRHYGMEGAVAAGAVSARPATLRGTLDVHYEADPASTHAYLGAAASHVTLADERGTLRFALSGGSCQAASLQRTGPTSVQGGGTLVGVVGRGAYRDAAVDGGTYQLALDTAPGADNAWAVKLAGTVRVLSPGLAVEVADTYWGNLGLDYLTRRVTVVYRVTNTGPGDSFGAVLQAAPSSTSGVTVLGGSLPAGLGDLVAGESTVVAVRYQLGLVGPCALVLLGCEFATTVAASFPDALDAPVPLSAPATAHAPDLPPPL